MIFLGKPQQEDEKNNIFSSDESESNEVSRCAKSTSKVTDNTYVCTYKQSVHLLIVFTRGLEAKKPVVK